MRRIWIPIVVLGLTAGCNEPAERLNAPPHGNPERTSDLQGTFVYMADNAMLSDMTISDVHFLPHRPLLSSLGRERLARMVSLMEAYGGTLRFSSDEPDERLRGARLATVTDFLREAGMSITSETIREDLPGGRGMDSTEVNLIKANEATYKPKKTSTNSGSPGGGASSSNQDR